MSAFRGALAVVLCLLVSTSCGGGVDVPKAAKPELLKVRRHGVVVEANSDGLYAALPARSIELDVHAPWPTDLDVSLDTGERFTNLLINDDEGWRNADEQDVGAWGTKAMDADTAPRTWTLLVSPPPSARLCAERVALQIRNVSLDTNLPEEQRVSEPLTVVLGRAEPAPEPFSLTVEETDDSRGARLTWGNVRFARVFEIARADAGSQIFTTLGSLPASDSNTFVDRTTSIGRGYTYRVTARLGKNVCQLSKDASIAMPAAAGVVQVQFTPENPQSASSVWVAKLSAGAALPPLPRAAVIDTVLNQSADSRITDIGTETRAIALDELRYANGGGSSTTALAERQTSDVFRGMAGDGTFRAVTESLALVCIPLGSGPRRSSPNEAGCKGVGVRLQLMWRLR